MKARFFALVIGLGFAVTLAIVIGQRLSAEAMAVMVGVVAGVAASIPTSLMVVWFASRTLRIVPPGPVMAPAAPEPRIVVVPQATPPSYQNLSGYAPAMYPTLMNLPAGLAEQRQFNVIGGVELATPEAEAVWRP